MINRILLLVFLTGAFHCSGRDEWFRGLDLEPAAAIRDPRAVGELRKILATSNDVAWDSAAVRGLGRLGVGDCTRRA